MFYDETAAIQTDFDNLFSSLYCTETMETHSYIKGLSLGSELGEGMHTMFDTNWSATVVIVARYHPFC